MKQNKKRKKALIKRRIRRIAYATLAVIMLSCVALVSYILLIDRGMLKIHPVNRIEVASEPNTGYVYQEVVIPNIKVDTDESKPESNKEETLEPDAVYVCQGTVTGTIDNIDLEIKSQNASESNTSTANGNVAVSEEVTIDTTPKSIEVETIGDVKKENVESVKEALKLVPQELTNSFVENKWHLYVTKENLQRVYNLAKPAMALTDHTNHLLKFEDREEISKETVLHEMGHYLEAAIYKITGVNPSQTKEFIQIYIEEALTFKENTEDPGYIITNSREFFAEMFCYYIVDPSKCTPKAYQYIEFQLEILEERSL